MRGHIAQKGRRYYVVIYEGVDSSTGKSKRRWHAAGDTRVEAEKLLAELVKRVHDGDYRAPDKITVGDYLRRHSADDTTAKAIRRIMRADVIVIDDIGLLPVATETAEALYRVVGAAYEKRSIALSSNLHPAKAHRFDELMPKTIANATVDRLLHHAHIVLTAGDSIRLTQATAGKGVTPLTN